MNDELVERIESNPKYQELVSKRTSLGVKLGVFVLVLFYSYILTIAFNKCFIFFENNEPTPNFSFWKLEQWTYK